LIRASINLRKKALSKKMDHRVKPGDDDLMGMMGKPISASLFRQAYSASSISAAVSAPPN
jgi:hypothetical protein